MAKYLFVILAFFIIISQCHAQDANVIQLQKFLSGLGYYQGTIDGVYGPNTATAVSRLQQYLSNKGYYSGSIDGVFGPDTATAVNAYNSRRKLRANTNTYPQQKSDTSQKYTYKESQQNTDAVAIASIAYLIGVYFSHQAFKEERTAYKLSKEISLNADKILTICASFNPVLIAIVRWVSYGIIIFLLSNKEFMVAGGLCIVKFFFTFIIPINYEDVLRNIFLPKTLSQNNIAIFHEVNELRNHINFVLQRGTLPV